MLEALRIAREDDVVEFAPGMGVTARLTIELGPASYTHRLLKRGGRYGIHEMCLLSGNLDEIARKETERALTSVVHHGVRPLAVSEWRALLESEGFEVKSEHIASMSLLEPRRLISDEGLAGTLRFVWNALRDSEARRRVMEMRSVFRRYRKELGAVALVANKS